MQRETFPDVPSDWRDRQNPTVLVVDDTPDNLALMSELLGEHYRVKVASSGERALKAVQSDPVPDLVLLDIMMPGMDGYEVCRQLKASAATRDIPVIFLTARDETGNHIRRTQLYVKALAERLRVHPLFEGALNTHMIDLLYKSAPLHDIGKIGVPDAILLKPGKLTDSEFETIKEHTLLGRKAIEGAERRLGMRVRFLNVAKDMACSHHERWDGTGYPMGLAGDAIPVPARLMALADVYDAIISQRVYKTASTHEQACSAIVKGRGTQFDPDVVDAFIDIADDFRSIALKYPD